MKLRCLVTWFCYHLIAKPGNKTGAPSWPDQYTHVENSYWEADIPESCILRWKNGLYVGMLSSFLHRAVQGMLKSESYFSNMQELLKNAMFMKQQISYEQNRRSVQYSAYQVLWIFFRKCIWKCLQKFTCSVLGPVC